MTVVVNPSAGSDDGASLVETIAARLPAASFVEVDDDLVERLERAAADGPFGIVGGDGSVNAAVEVSIASGRPVAVFPGGTLNHFARDAGLGDAAAVADAVAAGHLVHVDVGRIDGRPFLNTASLGPYAEMVDERERMEGRLGKWLAAAVASYRVLRRSAPMELLLDGRRERVWVLFVGNCEYTPPVFVPTSRADLCDGRFDVRWLDAGVSYARARMLAAALLGPLGRNRAYRRALCDRLEISSLEGPLRLARDGETFDPTGTLVVIEKDPRGLDLFRSPS